MIIKTLKTENFRNLQDGKICFDDGVNVLTGLNAQGKTNIIEALWLFSSSKSFRTNNEKDFINYNASHCSVSVDFIRNKRRQNAGLYYYEKKRREIYLNDIKVKPSELIGNFSSVLFFPSHLNLVKEGPDMRRKFVDFALSQIKPQYFSLISDYSKVLFQRNNILKSEDPEQLKTLEVWDIKLSKLGARIYILRKKYIRELEKHSRNVIDEISDGKETLLLDYLSICGDEDNIVKVEELLMNKLFINRERDILLGYTDAGVHKDDFGILINGRSAKAFASQGQQRSAVMALKLAEAEILRSVTDEYPVLLFDDVFSELDKNRKNYIVEKIKDKQVIITACESISDFGAYKLFNIKCGKVKELT